MMRKTRRTFMTKPSDSNTITTNQWLHSCYVRNKLTTTVVVAEKTVTIDKHTKEVLHTTKQFRYFDNPKRKVWITKPAFRTHKYKKLTEEIAKCDMYHLEDRSLGDDLCNILDIPKYPRKKLREILNNPYVYNADMSMGSLIRCRYEANAAHTVIPLTTGSLDIEQSVLGCQRINLITVVIGTCVYTAALDDFMWKYEKTQTGERKVKATADDINKLAHELLKSYFDKYKLSLHVRVFAEEINLIRWIFDMIHKDSPDYMGIWNLDFDIPRIISRIRASKCSIEDFFCHPNVRTDCKYARYAADKRETQHIIDKWPWMHNASLTQFIDAMCQYGRLRKKDPKEISYSLDYISTKVLGAGKLKFGASSHFDMQSNHFVEYAVYNILDALLIQLMEWKNGDTNSMYHQTEHSHPSEFGKQTVMLKNAFTLFCFQHKGVFATTGTDMTGPFDNLIPLTGGAVLNAKNTDNIGLHCVTERPWYETCCMVYCADCDFTSVYPNTGISFGLSKDTKYATLVEIPNHDIHDHELLFGGIAAPMENAVLLGTKFFNLPTYTGLEQLIDAELTNHIRNKYNNPN